MDFETREHHLYTSPHDQADFDLLSFDEAFDTEALKRYYNQNKYKEPCSMEEETHSLTSEALSPATTQMQSPMGNSAHQSGENFAHTGNHANNNINQNFQGPKTSLQEQLDTKKTKSKKPAAAKKEPAKKKKAEEPPKKAPEDDMIAMIMQQIASQYSEPTSTEQMMAIMEQEVKPVPAENVVKKKRSRKNSKVDNEDDKHSATVLNRLICKKKVFKIVRKEEKPVRKNSTTKQSTTKVQRKKSSVPAQTPTESLASTTNDSRGVYFDWNPDMVFQEFKETKEVEEKKFISPEFQVRPALFQFDLKVNKPEVVKKNVFANLFSNGKSSAEYDDADYLS